MHANFDAAVEYFRTNAQRLWPDRCTLLTAKQCANLAGVSGSVIYNADYAGDLQREGAKEVAPRYSIESFVRYLIGSKRIQVRT